MSATGTVTIANNSSSPSLFDAKEERRQSEGKFAKQIEQLITQGRRNSAVSLIQNLRSGSLSSWATGGPLFPGFKNPRTDTDGNEEASKPPDRVCDVDPEIARQQGIAQMGSVVSALYAKMLVIMGLGFPLAEVISNHVPQSYFDGFYLYLYLVSILFMGWNFAHILRHKATQEIHRSVVTIKSRFHHLQNSRDIVGAPDVVEAELQIDGGINPSSNLSFRSSNSSTIELEDKNDTLGPLPVPLGSKFYEQAPPLTPKEAEEGDCQVKDSNSEHSHPTVSTQRVNFGSFYLRMGAVCFGIGAMIYSGLDFGHYFEIDRNSKCHNYLQAVTSCIRILFTFMQMYFIFLNSRMAVSKVSLMKQFGLMHMIGTNLCVWLNILIQETKHEITNFYDPETHTLGSKYYLPGQNENSTGTLHQSNGTKLHNHTRVERSSGHGDVVDEGPHSLYDCRRENIIGSLVESSSPFLFPAAIEYALICAAVCYVMWGNMAERMVASIGIKKTAIAFKGEVRSPHHYTVDCSGSNKGFFIGIFFLVVTIMSLILNFVFMQYDAYMARATFIVNVTEVILYTLSTAAVLGGICTFRTLRYMSGKNLALDSILLLVAQSGSFIFHLFCIIGGHFTLEEHDGLVLIIPSICLIQVCLQTLFILDASKRVAANASQRRKKPGREIVAFLLVTNLSLWLINALEKIRGNSHPYLLSFYGVWAWTIITRISMPLDIFYRFHSTVCLCEIWKKAYKLKNQNHSQVQVHPH